MTFSARRRDTIRDEILGYWSAEYSARGKRLLTSEGSDAWVTASALAVVLEAVDAQAEQVALDILPDEASTDALNRHGSVNGVDRRTGVKALVTVTVTGPIAGPFSIPSGTQMVDADSAIFNVEDTSVTLAGGSPTGTLTLVRSALAGAAYTPTVGDTLIFVSAPTGLNSTGTVAAVTTDGTDEESDDDYRERIISTLRDRPASGNRADWKRWAEEYTALDIRDVWVYSLLQPPTSFPGAGTEDVLGCLTVVVAGAAQGDSTTNTRLLGQSAGTKVSELTSYVNGDVKADGSAEAILGENQRRPVTISDSDFAFQVPSVSTQAVVATVTVNAANAATWSGSHAIVSATTTSITVAGDQSALVGSRAIANIGTANKRGGYTAVTLQSAVFGGVNTVFTLAETLAAAPSGTMYPAVGNWEAICLAVFAFFDALGPGDTSTPSRFPGEEVDDRATLYPQALAAAIMTVDGVLSCSVTTPAGSVVPAAKTIVTLDTLRVTP